MESRKYSKRWWVERAMNGSVTGLNQADYVVIGGFFLVMLFIGLYYARRMRTLQDYFSGGREVPWWLSGTSFYMSSFSAFTFVAYSELAYKYGWVSVTIFWVTIPSSLIGAYFFAARWRRAASTSPLEYIEERYGFGMRQCLAWLGIPVKVIDDGLKLFAIGTLVSSGLGFPLTQAIILSGSIILAYTFLGGLWAVLVTDFVQFIVMLVVVAVLLPLAFQAAGGWDHFVQNAPEGFFAYTSETYDWTYLLAFLIIIALNFSTSWSLVQRYYSVRRDRGRPEGRLYGGGVKRHRPASLFPPSDAGAALSAGSGKYKGSLCAFVRRAASRGDDGDVDCGDVFRDDVDALQRLQFRRGGAHQ